MAPASDRRRKPVDKQILKQPVQKIIRLTAPPGLSLFFSQSAGQVRQHIHLYDQKCLQFRRGDRRNDREDRGIVPAGIVAVVVFAQAVSVVVPAAKPPPGPLAQARVGFLQLALRERHVLHHPAQRPAVDRRFAVIPDHVGVVYAVRQKARGILPVEHQHELIPRLLWRTV